MANTVQNSIRSIIKLIGDNPNREGLIETPDRVNRMYAEIFRGYKMNPKDVFKVFDSDKYNGLVMVKDIEFYSHCEHHLVPFFGRVHIGYKPNGKIIGISKLGRLVEIFSRRLQVQERMTTQIRESLDKYLNPKGAAVVIEAKHLCMAMRGVQKQNALTVTASYSGVFEEDSIRKDFLNYIYHKQEL